MSRSRAALSSPPAWGTPRSWRSWALGRMRVGLDWPRRSFPCTTQPCCSWPPRRRRTARGATCCRPSGRCRW
eukprot:6455783-Alexandrium_andersonii.AAC.1